MNVTTYDAWRLSGPDEQPPCPCCDDTGLRDCRECEGQGDLLYGQGHVACNDCGGSGVAVCNCAEARADANERARADAEDAADHRYQMRKEDAQ